MLENVLNNGNLIPCCVAGWIIGIIVAVVWFMGANKKKMPPPTK